MIRPMSLTAYRRLNGRIKLKSDDATYNLRPRDVSSSSRTVDIPSSAMLRDRPTQVRVTIEREELHLYPMASDKAWVRSLKTMRLIP